MAWEKFKVSNVKIVIKYHNTVLQTSAFFTLGSFWQQNCHQKSQNCSANFGILRSWQLPVNEIVIKSHNIIRQTSALSVLFSFRQTKCHQTSQNDSATSVFSAFGNFRHNKFIISFGNLRYFIKVLLNWLLHDSEIFGPPRTFSATPLQLYMYS